MTSGDVTLSDAKSVDSFVKFTHLQAIVLVLSIITYLVDVVLDVILAVTYFMDGFYWYGFITILLVTASTVVVNVFSLRWHQMDEELHKSTWLIHCSSLGVLYRYLVVINEGLDALKNNLFLDYIRYYQQLSDVCMLRLFDSFLESAPQLVFHLFIMVEREEWPPERIVWTGLSAIASTVSLGWGIAAYNSSLSMVQRYKEITWTGMILQTLWRFGMLAGRITSLLLLALLVHEWIIIALFLHWMIMTVWVILQETDFCSNIWEERLYNAVVGVIYCFAFFNLKEGRSRYRATAFYMIIIAENAACVIAFFLLEDFEKHPSKFLIGLTCASFTGIGTMIGLLSMVLYYRFFHPGGAIPLCLPKDGEKNSNVESNTSLGPDFVIEDVHDKDFEEGASVITPPRPPRKKVEYSRSFKDSCPPYNRNRITREHCQDEKPNILQDLSPSSIKEAPKIKLNQVGHTDSAYGTDSNRTMSRSTISPSQFTPQENLNDSNRSFSPRIASNSGGNQNCSEGKRDFNNTYASVNSNSARCADLSSDFSQCSQTSADSRITVIANKNTHGAPNSDRNSSNTHPEKLLKRSPVVKDVTSGFAQITSLGSSPSNVKESSSTNEDDQYQPRKHEVKNDRLTAPLTIIIPNISHQAFASRCKTSKSSLLTESPKSGEKTISLEILNPQQEELPDLSSHDYENLALVNINRAAFGVSHWHTYSDMANNKHDESTAYERKKQSYSDYSNYGSLQYYDIYPLSKEMKEQLYRSLTPCSTAATMASGSPMTNASDSDTYEPIESFSGIWHQRDHSFAIPDRPPSSSSRASSSSSLPLTLIHHDGRSMVTRQVVSLDNLKEVLEQHQKVPMDDPQDRGDLYLLAPMRLLTPILEEPEHDMTSRTESTAYSNSNYAQMHRSILTVISEILYSPLEENATNVKRDESEKCQSDLRDSINSNVMISSTSAPATSSLVRTIEEIRNTSLCNLFVSSAQSPGPEEKFQSAAPQVPPRNPVSNHIAPKEPIRKERNVQPCSTETDDLDDIRPLSSTPPLPALPDKPSTPLQKSVGTRKNIIELAGKASNVLNTPKRPSKSSLLSNSLTEFEHLSNVNSSTPVTQSSLHSVGKNSMPLSPSSKYETPTPPLRPNQFVRNASYNRPTRRKFSVIRDKFEPPAPLPKRDVSKSNHDLYQNISDDLLSADLSKISKCVSSPSFVDSKEFELLRPEDQYENLQRGWATSSAKVTDSELMARWAKKSSVQSVSRLHESHDKENQRPPELGPKPSKEISRTSRMSVHEEHHSSLVINNFAVGRNYRMGSLSPKSRIFARSDRK